MEHDGEDAKAVVGAAVPSSDGESVKHVVAVLEREAAALRRGRRSYRLVLTFYILLAVVTIGWRAIATAGKLAPAKRTVIFKRAPSLGYAIVYAYERDPEPVHREVMAESGPPEAMEVREPPIRLEWWRLLHDFPWLAVGAIAALGGCVFIGLRCALRRQKSAARSLSTLDDIRTVGPLVESLQIDDSRIHALAAARLLALLPRLQASDSRLLGDTHHSILGRELKHAGHNGDLALAVLKAYEQVGDQRDIEIVRWMAEGNGPARSQPDVRQAAQDCLPFLSDRARRQREVELLLRPSEDVSANESLLRAAVPHRIEQPKDLLRAFAGDIDAKRSY